MQLFFCDDLKGNFAYFDEEESRHLTQVLRRKVGDAIHFTDGNGNLHAAKIVEIQKRAVILEIFETKNDVGRRQYDLQIAIAPTKNMDRLEWFVEKAVEIGVSDISLIICKNSERTVVKTPRLQGIATSAMKQSLKTELPQIQEAIFFEDFLKKTIQNLDEPEAVQKFIAHCQTPNLPPPSINRQNDEKIIILIGPEGDFTMREVALAKQYGFVEISLGTSRLRTETAGIVAVHTVSMMKNFDTKI